LRIRTTDRLIKAKAAHQRLKDEIKAAQRHAQYRKQARHIDEDSDEGSDEDSDEGTQPHLDIHQERDWNTCVNLSCFVLLLLVFNLLLWQYFLTRQV
jgi:hypothetical protein